MKKIILLTLVLFMLMPLAYAIRVGVYAEFQGRLEYRCVDIDVGESAKTALDLSGLKAKYSLGGQFLDSIGGVANDYPGSISWWLYYDRGNGMKESQVGISALELNEDESIIYLGYYSYDGTFKVLSTPKDVHYDEDACPQNLAELEVTNYYVETGGKIYSDLNETAIEVRKGQDISIFIKLKNHQESDVLDDDPYTAEGEIRLAMGSNLGSEDFEVFLGESDVFQFNIKFPHNEIGLYRGSLVVEGSNSFETYKYYIPMVFRALEATTTITEIAMSEPTIIQPRGISTAPTTIQQMVTGEVTLNTISNSDEKFPLSILLIGLGIAIFVMLALILIMVLK